jgi:23S rRNA (guanine745-N1)-methyltransferase
LLRCPRDHERLDLTGEGRSVGCGHGHCFDLAWQGYLNLASGAQPRNADSLAMVAARARFLSSGTYADAEEAVLGVARQRSPARILDCGAGTGHLLARLLDAWPARGVALDVSVPAARRAARAHERIGAVVADAWKPLPLAAQGFDLVISNFAPRNPPEFARVLAPDGRLVTVTPTARHLTELQRRFALLTVQVDKGERLERSLDAHFQRDTRLQPDGPRLVEFTRSWSPALVRDAIGMGPNAFHRPTPERVAEPVEVTVSVEVSLWRRRR